MITKYLNWLTEIPEDVTIKEVMPIIIIFCMLCMIMSFGITIAACYDLTWKKIIKSTVILTPYIMFLITWIIYCYFHTEPIYISMIPIYIFIAVRMIKKIYKRYKDKEINGGNS